jgi:hypothetical protein
MGKRLQKREVNFEQDAYGIFRLSFWNLSMLIPFLNFLMLFSFIRGCIVSLYYLAIIFAFFRALV